MKWFIFILSAILSFNLACAQNGSIDDHGHDKQLDGDDILDEFLGQTFNGAYSLSDDNEPTRFFTESHEETSEALYTEDGLSYPGIWTIRKNLICYQYASPDMTGGCFQVFKTGNCYFFYGDNVPANFIGAGKYFWTARSVIKGTTPDCDPGIS